MKWCLGIFSPCSVTKMQKDYPETAPKAIETVSRVLKQPKPTEAELSETEKALTAIKHILSDIKLFPLDLAGIA